MSATAEVAKEPPKADYDSMGTPSVPLDQIFLGVNVRQSAGGDLSELVASVRAQGVLEPVLLAPSKISSEKGARPFTLIAGFRRVAAAKAAGLKAVPARVLQLDGKGIAEVRLTENLQREGLTALEEAHAFQSYLSATNATQQQLADKLGKSQPYVANRIRLLVLPAQGAKLLETGKISPSAAEHLIKLPEAAAPEVKRAFADLERKAQYRGAVTVHEAKWAADSALRNYHARRLREKTVAGAKVPSCPVKSCRKKGRPPASWDSRTAFQCSNGHRWSPASGKLEPAERQSDYRSPAPRKPTLPLVEAAVPLAVPMQQVTNRVIGAIKGVSSLQLSWRNGTKARIELDVEVPSLRGAQVPSFSAEVHHKFLDVDNAGRWAQQDDAGRRRAAKERAHLVAWLESFGRAKKASK